MSNLKIDSFSCSIITPEKKDPLKFETHRDQSSFRFSPTVEQKETLVAMDMAHLFLCHSQAKYSRLEEIELNSLIVLEMKEYISENMPDVPDIIIRQEEKAIDLKDYSESVRNHMAEEFEIPPDYSFMAICILNYSDEYNKPIIESAQDLLVFFSESSICEKCLPISFESNENKHLVEMTNLKALKAKLNQSLIDPNLDDSGSDRSYKPTEKALSESTCTDAHLKDVYEFDSEDSTDFKIINPFSKETTPKSDVKMINSTMKSYSKVKDSAFKFPSETSPIKKPTIKKDLICVHCDKQFKKLFNLKLHSVSVHKIYPDGMNIFECPEKGCTFVSGNKMLFNRHHHKAKHINASTFKCYKCKEMFTTKSSLIRHNKRKHKLN